MSDQLTGTLYKKFETETRGKNNDFQVRKFRITTGGEYSQTLEFELKQDNCPTLDGFEEGSEVAVNYNLKGREWTNPQGDVKCFNTLEAWRIESASGQTDGSVESEARNVTDKAAATFADDEENDLPF